MLGRDKKEKVSLLKEIFSPEYLKRDFALILGERKTSPFAFWGLSCLIVANCLAVILIFGAYVIYAVSFHLS